MSSSDTIKETRRELKIKILQLRADEMQKKMDNAMDNIENMTQEYSNLMRELQEAQGISEKQNMKHIKLMARMMGETAKTNVDYEACNTSEEMLQLVMNELNQVKKIEEKMKEQTLEEDREVTLPDVGDNTEIWDRIARAQKSLKEEEENKTSISTTSPLEVVSEENFTETRSETFTGKNSEEFSDSSSSVSSTDDNINDLHKSIVI